MIACVFISMAFAKSAPTKEHTFLGSPVEGESMKERLSLRRKTTNKFKKVEDWARELEVYLTELNFGREIRCTSDNHQQCSSNCKAGTRPNSSEARQRTDCPQGSTDCWCTPHPAPTLVFDAKKRSEKIENHLRKPMVAEDMFGIVEKIEKPDKEEIQKNKKKEISKEKCILDKDTDKINWESIKESTVLETNSCKCGSSSGKIQKKCIYVDDKNYNDVFCHEATCYKQPSEKCILVEDTNEIHWGEGNGCLCGENPCLQSRDTMCNPDKSECTSEDQ